MPSSIRPIINPFEQYTYEWSWDMPYIQGGAGLFPTLEIPNLSERDAIFMHTLTLVNPFTGPDAADAEMAIMFGPGVPIDDGLSAVTNAVPFVTSPTVFFFTGRTLTLGIDSSADGSPVDIDGGNGKIEILVKRSFL